MRKGTTALVAFPLSHTLSEQRAVHYLLDEHPQNPQNPCSKKTKSHPSELHFR